MTAKAWSACDTRASSVHVGNGECDRDKLRCSYKYLPFQCERVQQWSAFPVNMGAVDPTYPLLPIAKFLSAAMLLVVLLTNFIRQSWNLGVIFLCFWLAVESLIDGVNTVVWSDNDNIKLYTYCDIGT